ncbi:MAG: hypothetical protein WB562_10020 [Candidatus Sulfotelmatobacter sp.]
MIDDEWPKGAVAMTKQLDLLKDEPLELAIALCKLAEKNAGEDEDDKEWPVFAQAMQELVQKLEAANQPGRAADAKSE